jgi:hypothetical protein
MESLIHRRRFLGLAGLAGASWMTPVGSMLARAAEKKREPATSIIMLWMQGGPSQLETFDPHPGKAIAGGTGSIQTAVKDIILAPGLERTAEEMRSVSLIRSLTSKEGDHERGTYTMKTGFRPDPTVIQPSIGAIVCHELPGEKVDIPRHVSILPGQWSARGGFLGDQYDAFRMDDPAGPVPDTQSFLPKGRDEERLKHLDVVEGAFARGRGKRAEGTLHRETVADARRMMSSEQLRAFNVSLEPASVRKMYGDTPFGRGCLAARRLIEVGVRCVEVTLSGWDTHANNHTQHKKQLEILDPAMGGLLRDLRERKLLEKTVVLWCGEFGRTPSINPAGGRDHWPNGFTVAVAGGGIRGGSVVGETSPEGKNEVVDPVTVGDLHATVLTAVGIDPTKLSQTPIGRTIKFAEGKPIKSLLG